MLQPASCAHQTAPSPTSICYNQLAVHTKLHHHQHPYVTTGQLCTPNCTITNIHMLQPASCAHQTASSPTSICYNRPAVHTKLHHHQHPYVTTGQLCTPNCTITNIHMLQPASCAHQTASSPTSICYNRPAVHTKLHHHQHPYVTTQLCTPNCTITNIHMLQPASCAHQTAPSPTSIPYNWLAVHTKLHHHQHPYLTTG